MKPLVYILHCCLCWLLASCEQPDSGMEGMRPIGFAPGVASTRAELTTENLASMGVFAYLTQNGGFGSAAVPNYMYNREATKAGGNWTYAPPLMYWPSDTDDKVSFFAYAPHNSQIAATDATVGVSDATTTGCPTLTYTNASGQIDLLAATPLIDQTQETDNGKVKFALKHALTKVTISIKSTDSTTGPPNVTSKKVLKSLSVGATQQGTLAYILPGGTPGSEWGFAWNNFSTEMVEFPLPGADGMQLPATSADATVTVGSFFLLPRAEGASLNLSFDVYERVENVETLTATAVIEGIHLPASKGWTPGASITYLLVIDKTLAVVASDVSWENMNMLVDTGDDNTTAEWEKGDTVEGEYSPTQPKE